MSKKKNKTTQPSKPASGSGGGGSEEPLKVNWYVIGGAILIVGALVFFSIQQSGPATTATMDGCVSESQPCPPMTIDTAKQYTATVTMQQGGEFVIQLFADKAPLTVNSFVYLARQGFYDGTTFHRVLEGFMAQGGDPTGTGGGGPGYSFVDETDNGLGFDRAGLLAMANSGPGTNGSQFFITYAPTDWLNGNHTIFGEVIEGMEVVNGLTRRDPDTAPTFTGDVIASVTITEQ
jgi:cyclophilin family peptidyl-prolyl cis-trans isomerase